jgi:hypothetical protein
LFISTQFAIHAFAGSPFPEACTHRLLAGGDAPGSLLCKRSPMAIGTQSRFFFSRRGWFWVSLPKQSPYFPREARPKARPNVPFGTGGNLPGSTPNPKRKSLFGHLTLIIRVYLLFPACLFGIYQAEDWQRSPLTKHRFWIVSPELFYTIFSKMKKGCIIPVYSCKEF